MSSVSFQKLLNLAQQRALDGKGGLAASIAKMCLEPNANLSSEETRITYDILRELIGQVEMEVRRYVADYLAHRSDVPNELLEFLANDTIHVAYPILVYSEQLEDGFIKELIGKKQRGHHMAIAERPSLSTVISNALISLNDDMVSGKLLENPGALINDNDMELLIERSIDSDQLQHKLLSRNDITEDIAKRMYLWVGESTRQYILRNFELPDDLVNASICDAVNNAQSNSAQNKPSVTASDISNINENIGISAASTDKLYQTLMLEGQQAFIVEYAYATGVTVTVSEMIFDITQINTIAAACKAIRFTTTQFSELLKLFLSEKYNTYENGSLINKAAAQYEKLGITKADTYLENWRQSSDSINF